MEYKITFKNQLKGLGFSLFILIVIICFIAYQIHENNFNVNFRNGLIIFSIISFLPVLYLHVEYYCYNTGTKLKIEIYEKKLYYIKNDKIAETFGFEELEKIILFMPPSMAKGSSFQLFPFEPYHFAQICAKNGKIIMVTSLMAENVQDIIANIRGVTIVKKKRLFASILLERLWN